MLPQRLLRLDALPLTASGKLDRRALPLADAGAMPSITDDGDALEAIDVPYATEVAAAFREALGLPRVSAHADFLSLIHI